jgi:hypothetical protein
MKERYTWLVPFILTVAVVQSYAIKSLDEILVGGTYRMNLTTGDEIEGIVESKDDTSLIIESKGTPYTFKGALIVDCQLVEQPKTDTVGSNGEKIFSYRELIEEKLTGIDVAISINGGNKYHGRLVSVDEGFIKLDVNGTVIPFARSVVEQISSSATTLKQDSMTNANATPGPCDTIVLKNPETDDYGKPKDNIVLCGRINRETNDGVVFTTDKNVSGQFPYSRIVQVKKHTRENPETGLIKKYAMPLICPPGMMLVDVPPGKTGRPFFKVCIDKYEYPNKEGQVPAVNVPYIKAQALCMEQGKRLCTSEEWQWACSGLEGYSYSYGWTYDKTVCNDNGRAPEASGSRSHCNGKFGVMDMTGNVFEWVKNKDDSPAAMGGALSKCQAVSPGGSGDPRPETGFRCCKSN